MSKSKVNVDLLFHALGDPTRRAMLQMLSQRPLSVTRMAEPLDITLTAVVQHLQVLEESGLVKTEKLGRVRICRIDPSGFDALALWIESHRTIWERRLDRLGDLMIEAEPRE
jgi:DNA-binding transcriptional ArsR family regulator